MYGVFSTRKQLNDINRLDAFTHKDKFVKSCNIPASKLSLDYKSWDLVNDGYRIIQLMC